jgi:hypothetical protein
MLRLVNFTPHQFLPKLADLDIIVNPENEMLQPNRKRFCSIATFTYF